MNKFFKAISKCFGNKQSSRQVEDLYESKGYLEAYSEHTDLRVDDNPERAIGGMWEEIGQLQFDFMKKKGLEPGHTMLDIGCGTLRGGRHYIYYLDANKYHGIDISKNVIKTAKERVQKDGLSDKQPSLIISRNMDLKFSEYTGQQFDFILAQSVFTHLKPEHIKECFENIAKVMHENSVFYFTYNHAEEYTQTGLKDFCYPFSFFEDLAKENGIEVQDCSGDYPHPRGQLMVGLRLSH